MSSAALKVLNIPILLFEILCYLPLRDLLLISRVSSSWHHFISTTPALQAALYLQPSLSGKCLKTKNPLLQITFPAWFHDLREYEREGDWPTSHAFSETRWMKNPAAFCRAEASWRKMLVTQPPITRLVFEDRTQDRGAYWGRTRVCDLEAQGGLRMGILYDVVHEWFCQEFRKHPREEDLQFAIRWDGIPGWHDDGNAMSDSGVMYRQGWKSLLQEERSDTATLIMHSSESGFLCYCNPDGFLSDNKSYDFAGFRSQGAIALKDMDFQGGEWILL